MKNHNRLYYLLAAGSLTALLCLTFLLFRGNQFGVVANAASNPLTATSPAPLATVAAAKPVPTSAQVVDTQTTAAQAEALTDLQTQNAKLVQMIQVMQARERQYQSQLDAANQALQTLQAQAAAQPVQQFTQDDKAHEAHERHEGFGELDHDD